MTHRMDPLFFAKDATGRPISEARVAEAPAEVTLEWLSRRCSEDERVLRLQTDDGTLDPQDETELARYPLTSTTSALRRWGYLKHLFYRMSEGLVRMSDEEEVLRKKRAFVEIITRAPIRVRMAGRDVDVTFRGQAALLALASHDLRRRDIDEDLRRLADLAAEVEARRDEGRMSASAARRRLRRFRRIHRAFFDEYLYHTRAILANALTPDGSSADADDAPEWWAAVTSAEEAALLAALVDAGPGRLEQLGEPPADPDGDRARWREDFGYWSLLAYFEKESGVGPAAWSQRDVAQFSTWLRAGTLDFPKRAEA